MLDTLATPDDTRLARAAEEYVTSAFGADLALDSLVPKGLPHFVTDQYRFWQGSLLGQKVVLARQLDLRPQIGATANFIKHRELIKRELGVPIVLLLLDRTTNAVRRQLVERRVGFLAPGAQLYIPEALLDLRERAHSDAARGSERDHFSPTAQTLVLAFLLGQPIGDANLTELAERFGVAVMSASRALDELEAHRIVEPRTVGRQRRLQFAKSGPELWTDVEPHLQTPVRLTRTIVGELPDKLGLLAGESALANLTMLGSPRVERRAVPAARWKAISAEFDLRPATAFDEQRFEIETWSYDPTVLSTGPTVDPLSLYLTVRAHPDERVAQAADQLLEQFEW